MPRYIKGDLFSHGADGIVILAHACNPFGSWGGGIAAQFRSRYPHANRLYAERCKNNKTLLGTCLLVPADDESKHIGSKTLIACLFTSDFQNSESEILKHTRSSLDSLAKQLQDYEGVERDEKGLPVVNMPQINSGIFNVPWSETEHILNENRHISINVYTL